jgi:hypothetical protein
MAHVNIRLGLLALIAALLLTPASAQQPQLPAAPQSPARLCNAGCLSFLSACLRSVEGKSRPEICDTGAIACSLECDECSMLARCMGERSETDPEATRCREETAACMRKAAAVTHDTSRPLIRFEGGDGHTMETAVVIKGARNSREAIRAESLWIVKTHSDWRKDRQSLLSAGPRSYDRIEYVTPTARQVIYFDITDVFGKF